MSLKLCPFCGGRAKMAEDLNIEPASYWVFCGRCRAKTRPFTEDSYEDPAQAAMDAWNARTGRRRGIREETFYARVRAYNNITSWRTEEVARRTETGAIAESVRNRLRARIY